MDHSVPTEIEVFQALSRDSWKRAREVNNQIYANRFHYELGESSALGTIFGLFRLLGSGRDTFSDSQAKDANRNEVADMLRRHATLGNIEMDYRCPNPAEHAPHFPVYRLTNNGLRHLTHLRETLVA